MSPILYRVYNHCTGIYKIVRSLLKKELSDKTQNIQLLDVGGRTSPYTVSLPVEVTVTDIPRESAVQKELNLGFTEAITKKLKARGNVKQVLYDDMTATKLAPASYDGVVSVEVIEHVPADELFVKNIAATLKPGGFFLVTTPNGDHLTVIKNPDHLRHYKKAELETLLKKYFSKVELYYAVPDTWINSKHYTGLKMSKPFKSIFAVFAGFVSGVQTMATYKNNDSKKIHLVGICYK